MLYRICLLCQLALLAACTTSPETAGNGPDPFGQTVRAPFREMIANVSQTRRTIGAVYFQFDDASLSESNKKQLDSFAAQLANTPGIVLVEGHTDHVNSDKYNQRLGFDRALVVADYLRSAGVWEERLKIRTYGETRPAESNWSEAGRAENRRVTIRLVNGGFGMTGKEAVKAHGQLTESESSKESSPLQFLFQAMNTETKG